MVLCEGVRVCHVGCCVRCAVCVSVVSLWVGVLGWAKPPLNPDVMTRVAFFLPPTLVHPMTEFSPLACSLACL